METWMILLGPILFLALTIDPISAEKNDSQVLPETELARSLKEAEELWIKGDKAERDHALPKFERLLPQIESAVGKDSPIVGLVLFRIGFLYTIRGDHESAVSNLER